VPLRTPESAKNMISMIHLTPSASAITITASAEYVKANIIHRVDH